MKGNILNHKHNLYLIGKSSWRLEWSPYETKMLMDLYRRNVTQVGPMKKFKSKKEMFNFIANTISTRLNISKSAHQCENRYYKDFLIKSLYLQFCTM